VRIEADIEKLRADEQQDRYPFRLIGRNGSEADLGRSSPHERCLGQRPADAGDFPELPNSCSPHSASISSALGKGPKGTVNQSSGPFKRPTPHRHARLKASFPLLLTGGNPTLSHHDTGIKQTARFRTVATKFAAICLRGSETGPSKGTGGKRAENSLWRSAPDAMTVNLPAFAPACRNTLRAETSAGGYWRWG
jgi:hypothetical protein